MKFKKPHGLRQEKKPQWVFHEAVWHEEYQIKVVVMPRSAAEAEVEQVLGWAPDSLQCRSCRLMITGLGGRSIALQALGYGWKMELSEDGEQHIWQLKGAYCPGCKAPTAAQNYNIEVLEKLFGDLDKL